MNSADYVDRQIAEMKASGMPLSDAAWEAAQMCVGWPYVFGGRGQFCTPEGRRTRYNGTSPGKDRDNIKNKCKNFSGDGSCIGCKWFPGQMRTRFYDCRGFTYWILLQIYGWTLEGAGCTSQWNNEKNWVAKGTIDTVPDDVLVCLFYPNPKDPKVMDHTGLGYHGETVECSGEVIYCKNRNKKWTHWAIPKCVENAPDPGDTKPTLRKGDSGSYVTLLQTMLIQRGYSLPRFGADGKFGNETLEAVKAFQRANGLTADGVVGSATWAALENVEPSKSYTVVIPHLTYAQAEALLTQYPGAEKTEEK